MPGETRPTAETTAEPFHPYPYVKHFHASRRGGVLPPTSLRQEGKPEMRKCPECEEPMDSERHLAEHLDDVHDAPELLYAMTDRYEEDHA